MSCTYWLSKNAQCGKASPSVSIGKTLALCDEHDIVLMRSIHTLPNHAPTKAQPHAFTYGELFQRLGYKESA